MTIKLEDEESVKIRLASIEDANAIAQLSERLGYPVSQQAMQQRLKRIQQDEGHVVYVAERLDGVVVGWVHVHACQLVVTERQAMILGLIVDERERHRGIGRCLMNCVEQWAREQECWAVLVRSNIIRKNAHLFYEKVGYSNTKTSLTFCKVL